ncbi:MAG TPA: hypothetical protein VHC50_01280, partial [Puia sp.]|nr:hypothetical protein [Puia sp.]
MQKFKWALISLSSVAVVFFSAFVILKNRAPAAGDSSSEKIISSELLEDMEDNYRMNGKPFAYVTEDIRDNQRDMADLIRKGAKIVLRYSELNCNVCVDSAIAYFTKFSRRIGEENVILLVEYASSDYLAQLIRMNQIKLPNIYRIVNKEKFNVSVSAVDAPYLFVLDSSGVMKDVFYPRKEIPELSE